MKKFFVIFGLVLGFASAVYAASNFCCGGTKEECCAKKGKLYCENDNTCRTRCKCEPDECCGCINPECKRCDWCPTAEVCAKMEKCQKIVDGCYDCVDCPVPNPCEEGQCLSEEGQCCPSCPRVCPDGQCLTNVDGCYVCGACGGSSGDDDVDDDDDPTPPTPDDDDDDDDTTDSDDPCDGLTWDTSKCETCKNGIVKSLCTSEQECCGGKCITKCQAENCEKCDSSSASCVKDETNCGNCKNEWSAVDCYESQTFKCLGTCYVESSQTGQSYYFTGINSCSGIDMTGGSVLRSTTIITRGCCEQEKVVCGPSDAQVCCDACNADNTGCCEGEMYTDENDNVKCCKGKIETYTASCTPNEDPYGCSDDGTSVESWSEVRMTCVPDGYALTTYTSTGNLGEVYNQNAILCPLEAPAIRKYHRYIYEGEEIYGEYDYYVCCKGTAEVISESDGYTQWVEQRCNGEEKYSGALDYWIKE